MNLSPDTVLQRTKEIELRLDSSHKIELIINKERKRISNNALLVLDAFSHPVSVQQALKKLQVNGSQDWIEVTSTISKLYHFGALKRDAEVQFSADKSPASFGSAPIHIAMLNDRVRSDKFIRAIHQVVKEGDVVLDIGTGTGILAIAAARAGAKKVYAVEAGAMADVAEVVIGSTEVADKITVIRGWSTQIELPEKTDVLVSEIIGNDPFGEKVLQTFKDAHQRLLKPDARILPGRMKVFGLPVMISETTLKNRIVQKQELENWLDWYNIDFSALKNMDLSYQSDALLKLKTEKAKELEIAGEPLLFTETDFGTFQDLKISNIINAKAKGPFNGILMYFELEVGNDILSNHPQVAENTNSWLNPVWYFPEAEKIKSGDNLDIRFTYGEGSGSDIDLIV